MGLASNAVEWFAASADSTLGRPASFPPPESAPAIEYNSTATIAPAIALKVVF